MSYILLVEDNENDSFLARRALRKAGISNEIVAVADGAEALVKARANTPLLMLLDLKLVGMNGLDILRQMRRNGKLRKLPVILLTGSLGEGDELKALELGAKEVLIKPLDTDKLIDALLNLGFQIKLINPLVEDES